MFGAGKRAVLLLFVKVVTGITGFAGRSTRYVYTEKTFPWLTRGDKLTALVAKHIANISNPWPIAVFVLIFFIIPRLCIV